MFQFTTTNVINSNVSAIPNLDYVGKVFHTENSPIDKLYKIHSSIYKSSYLAIAQTQAVFGGGEFEEVDVIDVEEIIDLAACKEGDGNEGKDFGLDNVLINDERLCESILIDR